MQKQNEKLSQKLKDRIFYVALALGVVAIFSVVAVYTMGQDGQRIAQQEQDVKKLSEFAYDEQEDKTEKQTVDNHKTENYTQEAKTNALEDTSVNGKKEDEESEVASVSVGNEDMVTANTSTITDTAEETDALENVNPTEDGEALKKAKNQVPVVAETEALNFNSEETIAWPVSGTVLVPFSMETTVYFKTLDQYRCNPGMLINAGAGTTVKNVYAGKVTKVTSDNNYGNVVTVSLGNDYSVRYGQLDTVYVKEGDYLKEGESVGTIGKPTDNFAEEGCHLYFEMLQGENPVDPSMFME